MRECPFCGFDEGWVKQDGEMFTVQCEVCGSHGPYSKTREGAEEKWEGKLKTIPTKDVDKALKENIGGVSAPAATLANTPGVGTAQPASTAAMTGAQQNSPDALGSGDKWGGGSGDKKKKKKKKTKKTNEIKTALKGFANLVESGAIIRVTDGTSTTYIKEWKKNNIDFTNKLEEAMVFETRAEAVLKTRILNKKYLNV